jgi:hypothetical protein
LSIIAGIAGQPAELLDGAKVNSLIEYTSGNGVQLQGRTNGVAIEAGKVGQVLGPTTSSSFTPGAVSWTASGPTVTLTTGIWLLFGSFSSNTTVATEERFGLYTNGNNDGTGHISGTLANYIKGASSNGNITALPTVYYAVTGATQVIYGKADAISGTPAAGATFTVAAIRIA